MSVEIDETTIESLAVKLQGLDLSEPEGMLLESILYRAATAEAEVAGFGTKPGAREVSAKGSVVAAAGGIQIGGKLEPPIKQWSCMICDSGDAV